MEVTDAAGLANHRNDKDISTDKGMEIHGIHNWDRCWLFYGECQVFP